LLAEWGFDFIKVDDAVNIPELEAISKGVRSSGRKMLLSIVPDMIPDSVLKANAKMIRTGFDFWDSWEMLKRAFPVAATAVIQPEPGFWPDLDMLPKCWTGIIKIAPAVICCAKIKMQPAT
jgi:hypothetical protein